MLTPYFKQDAILTLSALTPTVLAGDNNGNVYVYEGTNIKKFDIVNNYLTTYSVTPSTSLIGTMAIVAGSAILLSTTTAAWENVELATGYKVQATGFTNGQCWAGFKAQQMAVNGNVVLGTNTGSRVFTLDVTTPPYVPTLQTPGWLPSTQISTIISKPDSANFFVGSATGVVIEITPNMNVVGGVTLPVTPNDGTSQTLIVTGLSYFSDILVVSTLIGLTFVYQWSTKTLLSRSFGAVNTSSNNASGFGAAAGGGGLTLCEAPSGVFLAGLGSDNLGSSTSFQPIFLGSISASGLDMEDYVNVLSVGNKVIYTGVDHTYNKGWAAFRTSSAGNFVTFKIPDAGLASVDFRAQFPIGTDVTYRNIVLKYNGPGRSRVILDQNLGTGNTTKQLRKNARYIGIAISSSYYDFRGIDT